MKSMTDEIKTYRELHGEEPPVGYEWDAGNTPLGDSNPGRWTVRRGKDNWIILFHPFPLGSTELDYVISTFSPTEDGESAAKAMALKIVDAARGRE